MEPDEAARATTKADRLLRAMPVEQYLAELERLHAELTAASAAEDDERAGQVFGRIHRLQRLSPQPEAALRQTMPATSSQLGSLDAAPSRVLGLLGRP
jgi:hypothetical protein